MVRSIQTEGPDTDETNSTTEFTGTVLEISRRACGGGGALGDASLPLTDTRRLAANSFGESTRSEPGRSCESDWRRHQVIRRVVGGKARRLARTWLGNHSQASRSG